MTTCTLIIWDCSTVSIATLFSHMFIWNPMLLLFSAIVEMDLSVLGTYFGSMRFKLINYSRNSNLLIILKHMIQPFVPFHFGNTTRTPSPKIVVSFVKFTNFWYMLHLVRKKPFFPLWEVRIWNDVNVSDIISSFEIENCFPNPLLPNSAPVIITTDLVNSTDKRYLNLIIRSKVTLHPMIKSVDLVQVQNGHEKTWLMAFTSWFSGDL